MLTNYPAQIVFTESDRGGFWIGRLLNPSGAVDTRGDRNPQDWRPLRGAQPFYTIKEGNDGRFHATFQGASFHGRRYRQFNTLIEAQRHAIRWAGQRFRILVEV